MITKTTQTIAVICILAPFFAGCRLRPTTIEPGVTLLGADRDAHDCIASAGYAWCARETACVRPWELAQRQGFAISVEAFARYCANLAP